jgi:hypothetical protein
MRDRVRSLVAIAAVVAATFVKVFPFSGHLFGAGLVLLLTRFQEPNELRAWFGRPPLRRMIVGGLLVAVAVLTIDSALFRVLPMRGLPAVDFSRFHLLRNDTRVTAAWIAGIWLLISPTEELIDRGFLIDRWNVVFGGKPWAPTIAVILSSVSFGLVHFYEGALGIIANVTAGLCFGTLYLAQRRNLWSNIIAHALVDTTAMAAFFLGWL